MDLNDFNTMVSASLKRGTTFDPQIPAQTALAVQWIERNYTFKYMETFRMVVIQPNQRVVEMPEGSIVKSWIFFRIINPDGSYSEIRKVEGKDLKAVSTTNNIFLSGVVPAVQGEPIKPGNFFQVGLNKVVLDAVPNQQFVAEALFYNYSSWPVDATAIPGGGSTFVHPLLTIATDLLLAQTQLFMATNHLKDMRMFQIYKGLRDEAVNTLTRAEDETKWAGEDMAMLYQPFYDEEQVGAIFQKVLIGSPAPPSGEPFTMGKSALGGPDALD